MSRCDPRRYPERGRLRGCTLRRSPRRNHRLVDHRSPIFRNISGSKQPVSVSVDDPIVSSATTATDTGTGDSSSNTGKDDWDRMDLALDLDATANALQVADGGGTVRGVGVSRKLSKNRKGKSPYLQDPRAPLPVVVSFDCAEMVLEYFADFALATAGITDGELWSSAPCEIVEIIEMDYPHFLCYRRR